MESLRYFLLLSTEKPLIIGNEVGLSVTLNWATIGIVVQGSQIVKDVAKNKLRENETRGFSYPFLF